ncbi:hypothetical protein AAKU52_002577, partial [Pedobacter sp. CG_S7]
TIALRFSSKLFMKAKLALRIQLVKMYFVGWILSGIY